MSGLRALIVDDQPHVLRVIKLGLERKGFQVESARNGQEALDRLREASYDVLVTDMEMPRMDGRGLCVAVQAEHGSERPFIVIVTGSADPELREWAKTLDRTRFLEKPLSLRALAAVLETHIADEARPA